MRNLILISLIILSPSLLFASKPIVAVVGVNSVGLGALNINKQINDHLINIIDSTRIFSLVNPVVLQEQLSKYNCIEEKCLLSFADTAGIDLVISGNVDYAADSVILTLISYGMKAPYFGRAVYKYRTKIPVSGLNYASDRIMEEHAGVFISRLLSRYSSLTTVNKIGENNYAIDSDYFISGTYQIYRFNSKSQGVDKIKIYSKIGDVKLINNNVIRNVSDAAEIKDGDFILIKYTERAEFLSGLIYGRKREMVFEGTTAREDFLLFLTTPPASVLMPLVAPLAYYKYGDYSGLALWALNSSPYLFLEYQGLRYRPKTYRDDKEDIPGRSAANYRFGIYMLVCGGMSLVVDSFAGSQLYLASNFQSQPNMGNAFSAVFLSLISGGGGHFYRGYRFSGYIYFHLDNILLYSAIKEFSPSEKYDSASGSYKKADINKKRGYSYIGILSIVKAVEITHALLRKDKISNGELLEEKFSFEPELKIDIHDHILIGAKFIRRI